MLGALIITGTRPRIRLDFLPTAIGADAKTRKCMVTKKTKKRIAKTKTKVTKKVTTKRRGSKKVSARKAMSQNNKSKVFSVMRYTVIRLSVIFAIALLGYTAFLDVQIRNKFEGQKWALPAHVYTRPMELYIGQPLEVALLLDELQELGYQSKTSIDSVGTYSLTGSELAIHQREFRFWDGLRPAQRTSLKFSNDVIESISINDQETEIVRLEPRLFGSVSPLSHEDRALLKLEEVPQQLIDALISIEDQQFYSHFGINPFGILRAFYRNLTAGRVVQGGSTLTQQLVKNYYLNSDQTLKRKFNEAIMSILLELHYSKDEILQAYLNEIHLAQAGNRAIHGFALGSLYFYGRPLQELDLPELALLAGTIKGSSFYNPIRHPERAEQRRNLVLKTMFEDGKITEQEYTEAIVSGINISSNAALAAPLSYPSFMGFVRENLEDEYQQDDLLNDGLNIYTTLNPRIQKILEQSVQEEFENIEQSRGIEPNSLQVAATVIRTDNGEVVAMVGDRQPSFSGFNRAVNARRPVGSLLKPFIYLTALEKPDRYSLASTVNDQAIVISQVGSEDWIPQNYDSSEHGPVMLVDALAKSYNLATVQLGMELGVSNVINTINRLGHNEPIEELPSLLLGAVPMTVMDISQLYLSLASGGFKTPIKSIRSVLSNDNEPLARYSLRVEQVVEPEANYLINYALQEVVRNGTGRGVLNNFRYDYGLAGKTGTTDDYRDSWFAGFSGNYLTVVWVGRDDNKPTGLTGASGAARVWAKAMQQIPLQRLELGYQEKIISQQVYYSSSEFGQDCKLSRQLPISSDSLPLDETACPQNMLQTPFGEDEERYFEPKPEPKRRSFWQRVFGRD